MVLTAIHIFLYSHIQTYARTHTDSTQIRFAYTYTLACSFSHLYTRDTTESNCQRAKGSETENGHNTHTRTHAWRIKKVKSSDAKGLDSIIFCDIAFYVSCIILLMSPQFSMVYINCLTSSLDSFSISFQLWTLFFPLRFWWNRAELLPMLSAMLNFIYILSSHSAMLDQDVGNISNTNDNHNDKNNNNYNKHKQSTSLNILSRFRHLVHERRVFGAKFNLK